MSRKIVLVLSLFLLLVLAACAQPGSQVPGTGNGETPAGQTPTASPSEQPGDLPPKAVLAAQQALAGQLGVPVEQVQISQMEQVDWLDTCLGLGGPEESCAQVITPGWRVVFNANGQEVEVRTDETGSVVRVVQEENTFDLLEALRMAGAAVEVAEEIPQASEPMFSVPVRRLVVNGSPVQVYEFAGEAAARAEAQRISPDGFGIGMTRVEWVDEPHFYQRDRVMVFYLGKDPAMLSLLESVLGPQFAGVSPDPQAADRVKIFLVALEDGGKSGQPVGCGDSLVAVERPVEGPSQPLQAALEELLRIKDQFYGESGLYNALYQSNLKVDTATIDPDGKAVVALSGEFALGGVCDSPRFQGQLEQTVRQFPDVQAVEITLNGISLDEALSQRG